VSAPERLKIVFISRSLGEPRESCPSLLISAHCKGDAFFGIQVSFNSAASAYWQLTRPWATKHPSSSASIAIKRFRRVFGAIASSLPTICFRPAMFTCQISTGQGLHRDDKLVSNENLTIAAARCSRPPLTTSSLILT
jgi:hypothetical protein